MIEKMVQFFCEECGDFAPLGVILRAGRRLCNACDLAMQARDAADPWTSAQWYEVGDRVRICLAGELHGQYGEIYQYLPGHPHPWHVRPDGWPADVPGVALTDNEMHLQ